MLYVSVEIAGGGELDNIRLRTRFIIMMVGILVVSLILNLIWSNYTQKKQAEKEMHEKAYVLSQQLDAVWDFMALNQDNINYDANGEYNFKRLHCSLVGKSIGKLFGRKTGYVIRYTNFTPRNKADTPDDFENIALSRFLADRDLVEFYDVTEYMGKEAFRYVAPMRIEENCLECHGEPAGELDVLDFPKEGWKVGDLGGAVSIVVPMDIYIENIRYNVSQEVAFFSLNTLLFILVTYFAVSNLVTKPLSEFKSAVEQIKGGDLSAGLEGIDAKGEIKDLAEHFSDMTQELQNLYSGLEKKVELRTQDLALAKSILESQRIQLEEANRRLQEDNQYKSDFLAIMSHELRTPLTSIIAFAEVLERSNSPKPDKELRVVHEIKGNSQILLTMINNILEMARLEAGKKELILEPIDLVDVINAVESVIEPLMEKKDIRFSSIVHRAVPLIEGDREGLRRIVENLVSNAMKFTPKGGEISVWVDYDPIKNEVLIKVQDNGIGIRKEDQPFIFEKFVQSDTSLQRQYNGSGLGLTLAKELAELHGGWISVVSELGQGSLFTVGIPAGDRKEGIFDEDYVSG
jgi:two-component system, NarL family, sensor histidine kinase BarA